MVDSILLPAHAVTSVNQFPAQLAGIWIARYTARSAIFRLTISSDGSAGIFQDIITVFGIPIIRIDTLNLESFSTANRQISWSSARTQIEARYDSAFDRLEGVEQIGSQTPSAFVATRL